MHTILDIINKTTGFFEERKIEKARLNAELLIAHALKLKRMDLYMQAQRPLEEPELAKIRPLLRRRANREPVQYIIGETDFWQSSLICRPEALIPRPETEELIEYTLKIWKQQELEAPKRILDLGTGTGAIAIAMAMEFPDAKVVATDLSKQALALASENAAKNGVDSRIQFLLSDWFSEITGTFDIILSNPPYLTQQETDTAQPEVQAFEPIQALVGKEADGAGDLRQMIEHVQKFVSMSAPHLIGFETGIAQHEALEHFSNQHGWCNICSISDLQDHPRFFFISNSITPAHA